MHPFHSFSWRKVFKTLPRWRLSEQWTKDIVYTWKSTKHVHHDGHLWWRWCAIFTLRSKRILTWRSNRWSPKVPYGNEHSKQETLLIIIIIRQSLTKDKWTGKKDTASRKLVLRCLQIEQIVNGQRCLRAVYQGGNSAIATLTHSHTVQHD